MQGPGEDGAYRLFVDDKLVVDNWTRATALVNSAALDLSAGPHKIRLELRRTFGDPNVRLGIVGETSVVSPDVAAIASEADAVIVAVGFDSSSESEGSDRTFRLPPGQEALIHTSSYRPQKRRRRDHLRRRGRHERLDRSRSSFTAGLVSGAGRRHGPGTAALWRDEPVGKTAGQLRAAL